MYNPVSTYRLQFHKGFTFTDFDAIIPYLHQLGVSTVYASPIFEAVPGSMHGYDVTDPLAINPEIGSQAQLYALADKLKQYDIGWIQDIVPNHMAFHHQNRWLMDVLELGRRSVYSSYFDINWESPVYNGRVMVPFLNGKLEDVIAKGELRLQYRRGRFFLGYYDQVFPLSPASYAGILNVNPKEPGRIIQNFLSQIQQLESETDVEAYRQQWQRLLLPSASLYLDECIERINGDSRILLQISNEQAYMLCDWQETDRQINYRRFFTVNSLICLNIHDEPVFNHYHRLIKQLADDGIFQGLRIDHIDGLLNPEQYLDRLRHLVGPDMYITVEKILETDEKLPAHWPVAGTTGYDFLAYVNNVLSNIKSEKKFSRFYQSLVGNRPQGSAQISENKAAILFRHMQGELQNLFELLVEVVDWNGEKEAGEDLKEAIGDFLILCPVYRFYGNRLPLERDETKAVGRIFDIIRKNKSHLAKAVGMLEDLLLVRPATADTGYIRKIQYFYQRMMQFSGPLMAKGVEDTFMYTYNRFIGHNEVGGSPLNFGISVSKFHELMRERQKKWPLSLNATSTHDTKRGEDVRARLNVLTDLSDEWLDSVRQWIEQNSGLKDCEAPDMNDEFFIYQTIIGSFSEGEDPNEFADRLLSYLEKAFRESKRHSNWAAPNERYEEASRAFARLLLDHKGGWWKSFIKLYHRVYVYGSLNSLVQVLLKFTCPGVPDVYQGSELKDLSFVDPDNRRAVDFGILEKYLNDFQASKDQEALVGQLWQRPGDGRLKLWLVNKLLLLRKSYAQLFAEGHYVPLKVKGEMKDNFMAFARRYQNQWVVVGVPLHLAQLDTNDVSAFDWRDTCVILPDEAPAGWKSCFFSLNHTGKELYLNDVLRSMPLLLLAGAGTLSERGAGILLAISSLPSAFGIGDLGPAAFAFADFLGRSRQKYWQLLPLNPTEERQFHSPYSSVCSMAGNPLLISPEILHEEALLEEQDCLQHIVPLTGKVNYRHAERVKKKLFSIAWEKFNGDNSSAARVCFINFCAVEKYWLDDFAIYVVLKEIYEGKPWHDWPEKLKFRDPVALRQFENEYYEKIEMQKWLQFCFYKQWHSLKKYCNSLGISMVGDLPYYVSYDSVDVWVNRAIFKIDDRGKMIKVAGVPPDYFNDEGQLWGMPVYRWDILRNRDYDWWLMRIRKNLEYYDLIRLDHFRAFSAYWEVTAGDTTARNGEWKPGPGRDFFLMIKDKLGGLPFLAEDLGDIDQSVYQLRDEFELPGMKVLQFAFGNDAPVSLNTPHNYQTNFFVYTGTHDNNTILGWFRQDADTDNIKNISIYTGCGVNQKSVNRIFNRLAYASVAKAAILPMQDLLALDETSRMNTPASVDGNWEWQLKPGQIAEQAERQLSDWVTIFNR